jgi:hypothetical protein
MHWSSITYFFIVTLLTGALIDLLVRDWEADWLEKLVMRFGVGIAAMSVIGVILNLAQIPLDYRVFLGVGVLITIGAFVRNRSFISIKSDKIHPALANSWKSKKFWYGFFMLVLFAFTLNMYLEGTFKYAYFEDTDPWGYTVVADFIGENKTFSVPYHSVHYSEPYTQGYQIVMGVLSQTNDSIYWTMKFFSSLVISFGILFMYYFTRRFSRNEEIAFLAGIFLFAVPAWVSHFVFSLHYNMTLFVVLLYVLAQMMPERREIAEVAKNQQSLSICTGESLDDLKESKGWMPVGIVLYASLLINHFTSVVHGSIFCFVFIVTRILAERKVDWKTIMVFMGGFLLSLLYFVPAYARHWSQIESMGEVGGVNSLIRLAATPLGMVAIAVTLFIAVLVYLTRSHWQPETEQWIEVGNRGMIIWVCGIMLVLVVLFLPLQISHTLGTGDQYYGLKHFFGASSINMMNNPFGLGFVIMSSVLVSFVLASVMLCQLFKPDNAWVAISYGWILTAFLLVLGKNLSIAIAPFRVWTFLGLIASLFAAWGVCKIVQLLSNKDWILIGTIALLTIIIIPTTYIPKHQLNTMVWEDHMIGAPESRELFEWMRNGGIPKNSVVAHLCGDSEFLSGYDMNPPVWDEVFHPHRGIAPPYFVTHPLDITHEAYAVLNKANVEYVTLGASCFWQAPKPPEQETAYGILIRETIDRYMTDKRLILVKNTGIEYLFKLKR